MSPIRLKSTVSLLRPTWRLGHYRVTCGQHYRNQDNCKHLAENSSSAGLTTGYLDRCIQEDTNENTAGFIRCFSDHRSVIGFRHCLRIRCHHGDSPRHGSETGIRESRSAGGRDRDISIRQLIQFPHRPAPPRARSSTLRSISAHKKSIELAAVTAALAEF